MQKQIRFQLFAIMLAASTVCGQSDTQKRIASVKEQNALLEEEIALLRDPANVEAEAHEAESDEHKVWVYRLFLKVPERKPSKGVTARKAERVAIQYRLQVTYHVATSQRREAQMEAMLLGADGVDALKIDREHYEAEWNIAGKPTTIKVRYLVGTKLVASQDLLAIDVAQANQIMRRMLKLEAWARMKSGNQ